MSKARHILDHKKKQIEDNLLDLVDQVKAAMSQAVDCLTVVDKAVCESIIETDPQINENRRLIEQDCLTAIALHQPVAHDLREIVAATRIAGELERAGDYASDIASIVMQMDGTDLSKVGLEDVLKLASLCTGMLDEVLAAYIQRDVEKAKQAAKLDDEIDAEHANLIEKLFSIMQSDPEQVPNASRMLWISHNLERCADRGTNIAEQIVFMLKAEVVELD
jgi:phosphate transport system protein